MAEIDESWLVPDPSPNPPLQKFAPGEMVTCEACLRTSPPTRASCMYCGASLPGAAASAVPVSETALDESRPAYYVVLKDADRLGTLAQTVIDQLAARFHLKTEELLAALSTGVPAPFAVYTSADTAQQAVRELRNIGFESVSVSDADLKTDIPYMNVHSLSFSESGVISVSKNGRERRVAAWNDLRLIVIGRLLTHRLEVEERRSRRSVKPVDRREITEDRTVIDVYLRSSDAPWRIVVNDFDFSCLGDRKNLTAFDNARALIQLLLSHSHAELNDSYSRLKTVLANVWPLEKTTTERRSQRFRAPRNEVSAVTSSDDEAQFNKYSRLVWRVKLPGTQNPD